MPAGPNVLLITLDSVRADVVGAYGHRPEFTERSSSPHLDRLADEGLLVEQAYATSSWTLPSHVSILTGEPELVHGVEQDGHEIHPSLPLVSERLRRAGWRTAGFYSGPYLDPAFGFGRGFERYEACYGDDLRFAIEDLERSRAALKAARGDEGRTYDALTSHANAQRAVEVASHRDRSAKHVADAVIAELERADRRPFFLFAHFFDPHYDYAPPEELARAFDPDFADPDLGRDFIRSPRISTFREGRRERVVDERGLAHLRAMYAAELAWTDSQIGRILERLERLGLADDTLVVVTADHGDEFFEHGSIGHRSTLYEELVGVPLLARHPASFPSGTRIEAPVSTIEIAPTILAACGLSHEGSTGGGLQAIAAGAAPGPVLGRLVSLEETTLELPDRTVAAARTTILETFRHGATKVCREVDWIQPTEALSDSEAAAAAEVRRTQRASERLRWVDLARSPDERAVKTDDPTREEELALDAFRSAYDSLRRKRVSPRRVEVTEDVLSALSGLGYVEQEARIGALEGDDLVLEAPGREGGGPRRD